MHKTKFYNRELSWLSFNHRVLQEAKDPNVPLYERIKFLAIFSSNLDEFFRVRVASLRSLLNLRLKTQKELDFDPGKLLEQIHKRVVELQEEYGNIFKNQIIPELASNNVFILNENQLNDNQKEFLTSYYNDQIIPHIMPMMLVKKKFTTFLRNNRLYLAVKLKAKTAKKGQAVKNTKTARSNYAIVEIPSNHLPRFIKLPKEGNRQYVIFLDDVLRFQLPNIFYGYKILGSYSVKLTRDAELYIDDEFSGNLLDKIKKSLSKRSSGVPCRFLYDSAMPTQFIKYLREVLHLENEDLFPGGKYHNLSDLFRFTPPPNKEFIYPQITPLRNNPLDKYRSFFEALKNNDYLLYYPYHSYDYVINVLMQAANDPEVISIKITQYRVAENSAVVNALIIAAQNGKDVTAFVEIKARFDEEINIRSAELMEQSGVKVLYSLPGLKVHAKLCIITKKENYGFKHYGYFATGNFNEKTARLYTDFGFFTSDERLTSEANKVFDFLEGKIKDAEFNHLLVAQFNMRKAFNQMIDTEIDNALSGKKAFITAKMNSLEDEKIIRKLYDASKAGVKINLIVRGICCLKPGVAGLSENINVISVVDRYLEHGRVFIFYNGGNERIYLSSGDWMKRNLSRRIEVAFPIYKYELKKIIKDLIAIQLSDNVKARIINEKQDNIYKKDEHGTKIREQYRIYEYLKEHS
jgi:polyphosphate kinase